MTNSNTTLSQALRVGLFFVFGLAMIWIAYETLAHSTFYKSEGYPVKVYFSDLKQLKLSDDVRMAGVRIGSVLETYLEDKQAVAILNIENDFLIPRDSLASIGVAGLLGANYIAIVPGQSQKNLEAKDTIASIEKADLNSVVEQIGNIGKRVDKFFSKLEQALGNEGEEPGTVSLLLYDKEFAASLKTTVSNIEDFSKQLNNKDSTLGYLLNDDKLYQKTVDAVNKVQNAVSAIEDSGPITAVGVTAAALF